MSVKCRLKKSQECCLKKKKSSHILSKPIEKFYICSNAADKSFV